MFIGVAWFVQRGRDGDCIGLIESGSFSDSLAREPFENVVGFQECFVFGPSQFGFSDPHRFDRDGELRSFVWGAAGFVVGEPTSTSPPGIGIMSKRISV